LDLLLYLLLNVQNHRFPVKEFVKRICKKKLKKKNLETKKVDILKNEIFIMLYNTKG
jgi:hypothetical protein